MPHHILRYPFNITPAGNAAVIPQGGEQEAGQTVLVIVSTVLGERPMAANFGIPDPAFVGLETADVATVLNDHGLTHIEVDEVIVEWPQEAAQQAEVRWRLAEIEPSDGDELGEGYDEA